MSDKTRSEERESSSGVSEIKKWKNSYIFTAHELEEKLSKLGKVHYSVNDRVLCKYPDGLFYEGKIIAVEVDVDGENLYTIHYQGWNSRHDEQIKQIDANKRFILYDEECAQLAKKAASDAKKLAAKKAELKKKENTGKISQKREKKSGSVTSKSSSNPSRDDRQDDQIDVDFDNSGDDSEAQLFVEPLDTIETKKGSDFISSTILDNFLIDDYDIITRQAKIPVVPARYTVKQICNDYISDLEKKLMEEKPENQKVEMEFIRKTEADLNTLLRFFNRIISLRLLYKIEVVQYRVFRSTYKNMPQIFLPEVEGLPGSSTRDDPNKFIDVVTTDVISLPSQTDIVENDYQEGERRSARVKKLEKQKAANEKKKAEKAKAEQQIYDLENYFECTHMYGFIHLVRFLYFLAELIKGRKNFPESVLKRTSLINNFVLYLTENALNYFDVNIDYENPEPTVLRDVLR